MNRYELRKLLRKLNDNNLTQTEREELQEKLQQLGESGLKEMMDQDWIDSKDTVELSSRMQPGFLFNRIKSSTKNIKLNRRLAIAASLSGLILLSIGLYRSNFFNNRQQVVEVKNMQQIKKMIQLEDGTAVWLKKNSAIKYRRPFGKVDRSIRLEGEAFFEVATDSNSTFTVTTENINTKVLGTSFNINAYPHHSKVEVALVKGAVEVFYDKDSLTDQKYRLGPGELLALNKSQKNVQKTIFKSDAPYAWKNDVIYFDKAKVEEVVEVLEAWYNIQLTIEHPDQIKGTLVHRYDTKKLSFNQVIQGITTVMDYEFKQQSAGKYIIRPKQTVE